MIDLNKLAAEIHAAAVEKGFWDVEDAENKHIAKMISELGEIVQADRAGVMYEVEHDGAKPEGVIAEIADFVMMTLDLMMRFGLSLPECDIDEWCEDGKIDGITGMNAYNLVCATAATLTGLYKSETIEPYLAIILCAYVWSRHRGYDLWEVIQQKMEYNKSRPALHGRLY